MVIDRYIKMAEEKNLPYYKVYGTATKGYILAEIGKTEEGLKHYKKVMKMVETEDMPQAMRENLKSMAHLWEFYAFTSQGDMEEAEKSRQRCQSRLDEKGNKALWKTYHQISGLMEIHKGNYDEARKMLTQAWDSPSSWYYMGMAWHKEGHKDKARKYYQKVADHFENNIELGAIRNKAIAGLKE